MYCTINFKTKKALKEAALKRKRWLTLSGLNPPATVLLINEFPDGEPPKITFWQRNDLFNVKPAINGLQTVEGPHFPKAHTWAAHCHMVEGEVVKVT